MQREFAVGAVIMMTGMGVLHGTEAVRAPKPASADCPDCQFQFPPSTTPPSSGPDLSERHTSLPDEMPAPLPEPENAVPLQTSPEKQPKANPNVEALVDQYLGDAPPEEQQIWIEELNGLPIEVARELLMARERATDSLSNEPLGEFGEFAPPPQSEPAIGRHTPNPDFDSSHQLPTPPSPTTFASSIEMLRQAAAIIQNNIANADTIGFKRFATFTLANRQGRGLSGLAPRRIETQGPLIETGRALDLALEGNGYFQLERDGVVGLTRQGMFHLNEAGQLVTMIDQEEWSIYPEVQIPEDVKSIHVDREGHLQCTLTEGGVVISAGRIELARVTDLSNLESIREGLWRLPEDSPTIDFGHPNEGNCAAIHPQYLEGSNVDIEVELDQLARVRKQIEALNNQTPARLANQSTTQPESLK